MFAILNCFRLRKQMASNKKATSRICFHENNSLTFALIYFHPPPSEPSPLVDELVTRFSRALPVDCKDVEGALAVEDVF